MHDSGTITNAAARTQENIVNILRFCKMHAKTNVERLPLEQSVIIVGLGVARIGETPGRTSKAMQVDSRAQARVAFSNEDPSHSWYCDAVLSTGTSS